jgi:hypothetical protein
MCRERMEHNINKEVADKIVKETKRKAECKKTAMKSIN